MAQVPFTDRDEKLLTIDNAGSGMIMQQDKLLGVYQPIKNLIPGTLTRAQRLARTDLLAIEDAKIKESDTGQIWEVVNGAWSREALDSFFTDTGMWSGLVSDELAAPWAVSSYFTGKKGLLPSFGAEPLYYRDPVAAGVGQVLTQPMVRDHRGQPRQTAAGQVLTWGNRIEENLLRFSNDLTNGTYWQVANSCTVVKEYDYELPVRLISGRDGEPFYSDRPGAYVTRVTGAAQANSLCRVTTGQVLKAVPHRVSFWARVPVGSPPQTFEVRLYVVAGATAVTSTFTLTAADGWKRLALNLATPDGSGAYVVGVAPGTYAGTGGGVVLIGGMMLQERRSAAETAPSEHIITDGLPVSARSWSGLDLDRIEAFGETNANTVTGGAFSASAGGVVVETRGTTLPEYAVRSSPTVQQFVRTDVNNWTQTRATVGTGLAAPDGSLTAYDIVEDAQASVTHFVEYTLTGTNTYDNKWMSFSVFAKQRSGGDRGWVYVTFADITAGTTKGAFFNLTNGTIGTVTAGLYAAIEPWADGYYRCMVRGNVGSGAADIKMRIFVADGNNSFAPTVSTTGNGVRVWCPNATGPNSSSGSARAMWTRPALNPSTDIGVIPGSILCRDLTGEVGSTEFAASGITALYGYVDEPYKSGTDFVYSSTCYATSGDPAVRCMISWRPGAEGGITGHTLKLAGDIYTGEVFDEYFWKPNTVYEVGDYVVPTDTLPTNSNGKKIFRCQVGGTSGATEPTWNTTYVPVPDTTTNVTSDGPMVKWQANINNGIDSGAEEYLGTHLKPTQTGFHQQIKWAWYQTATDYGMFLNGIAGVKQTYPQIESGMSPVLPKPLRVAWYGLQSSGAALPEAAPVGYNQTASMGVWDTDHSECVWYCAAPSPDVLQAATA